MVSNWINWFAFLLMVIAIALIVMYFTRRIDADEEALGLLQDNMDRRLGEMRAALARAEAESEKLRQENQKALILSKDALKKVVLLQDMLRRTDDEIRKRSEEIDSLPASELDKRLDDLIARYRNGK